MNADFSNSTGRPIKCPQCGNLTSYSSTNPTRPFCSDRCRILDLGAWAEESYRIPVSQSADETLDDGYENDEEA